MILLTGNAVFDDVSAPAPGKSEFGMDTLTRKMVGARSLLAGFVSGLNQGDIFNFNGVNFYLQTWQPDESTPFATVTLLYKGLLAGLPETDIQTVFVRALGSVSADFSLENPDPFTGAGKGRIYRKSPLFKFSYNIPGSGGESDVVLGVRDVYCTSATMEFCYVAVQSTYRYIAASKPGGPRYYSVNIGFSPVVDRARIHTSDGALYGLSSAALFDLAPGMPSAPVEHESVVDFASKHVIGSPYYECTDVVKKDLVQPGIF
jgi:hypothetical protein